MKLITLGDSTMQFNTQKFYPQVGWMQMANVFFKETLTIKNLGKNKVSTKSVFDLGIVDKAIEEIEDDTYVLIQFGHNDSIVDKKERYTFPNTTYKENLSKMISLFEEKGAKVILMTSTCRLIENDYDNEYLKEYRKVMKEVANERELLFIDCNEKMHKEFIRLGYENSKRYVMTFDKGLYTNYIEGLNDNTHLRVDGAILVLRIFVEALKECCHPLIEHLY